MLPKPEPACFVIADMSGYTSFLAAAELDHAQDIIADFMCTVVKGLRPPFRLAKFEGDAAFVYAVNKNIATHLEMRVAKPKPKDKDFVDQAGAKFAKNLTTAIGKSTSARRLHSLGIMGGRASCSNSSYCRRPRWIHAPARSPAG